jgi:hypothetical protein
VSSCLGKAARKAATTEKRAGVGRERCREWRQWKWSRRAAPREWALLGKESQPLCEERERKEIKFAGKQCGILWCRGARAGLDCAAREWPPPRGCEGGVEPRCQAASVGRAQLSSRRYVDRRTWLTRLAAHVTPVLRLFTQTTQDQEVPYPAAQQPARPTPPW